MVLTTDEFRSLIEAAIRAPSSHNTQPWLFSFDGDEIRLRADRTRALPVNDPFDRELTISCGAALFNLELTAASNGRSPVVAVMPDPSDPDLLARVTVGPSTDVAGDRALREAIQDRHSTREAFSSPDPIDGLAEALARATAQHDVELVVDLDRMVLADLVAEGDRVQFADPRWRRELASWMHPRRRGEGLVVPEVFGLATRAVVSMVDLGRTTATTDHDLILNAPVVAVVATTSDDPASWIEAGRALQHLLLTATTFGATAGYLNQPCQVPELRPRLQTLLPGRGFPQVVVRLGAAPAPEQLSPRRPVDDVIVMDSTPGGL